MQKQKKHSDKKSLYLFNKYLKFHVEQTRKRMQLSAHINKQNRNITW